MVKARMFQQKLTCDWCRGTASPDRRTRNHDPCTGSQPRAPRSPAAPSRNPITRCRADERVELL